MSYRQRSLNIYPTAGRLLRAVPVAIAVALATACGGTSSTATNSGGSTPSVTASCGGGGTGSVTATTARYVMTLLAGPVETMYSQADVNTQHPTTGEVMVRGQMTDVTGSGGSGGMPANMPGMSMAPANSTAGAARHLEIHICTRAGAVVADAAPVLTLRDTTGGTAADVPVAVMQGVTSGTADLHYGNNIRMQSGRSYTVEVRLNGETATIQVPNP